MKQDQAINQTTPVPASSTILLRDTINGLEVFMVARHHDIDRFSGALVFPGGKVDQQDSSQTLRTLCRGHQLWDDYHLSLRVAAIREAFEESGVLLARKLGVRLDAATNQTLAQYRQPLEQGAITLLDLIQQEGLELATDQLVHFGHWVTPEAAIKRFDTHFFAAPIINGYELFHDGHETVDSLWATASDLLSQAEEGRWTIVFPTRCNLSKIAQFSCADELLDHGKKTAVVTVSPTVKKEGKDTLLSIPKDAGYPIFSQTLGPNDLKK